MTQKSTLLATAAPLLVMTPLERQMGRFMRAPDHPSGDDGGNEPSGDDNDADIVDSEEGGDDDELDTNAEDEGEDLGNDDPTPEDDGEGEDDDADDAGEEGEDGGKPEKPNRTAERFAELTATRREAERRAAEATREAEKWRRIAEARPAAPEEPTGDDGKDPNAAPDPKDYPFGEADPDFIADNATFKAVQQLREEGEIAAVRAELNELEAGYQSRVPAALEKYPDFKELVIDGSTGAEPKWPCSLVASLAIRASEYGTDMAYHLASNPEEAKRIHSLPDIQQAHEMGKLEGRFAYEAELAKKRNPTKDGGEGGGKPEARAPKVKTSAPTPPKRQQRGQGGKFRVPPDTNDFGAFDKAYGNG